MRLGKADISDAIDGRQVAGGVVAVVVGRLATTGDVRYVGDWRRSKRRRADDDGKCDRVWTGGAGGDDGDTGAGRRAAADDSGRAVPASARRDGGDGQTGWQVVSDRDGAARG